MKKVEKIVFFHLLNDLSGSPKVLSQVIDVAKKNNFSVDLYTSSSHGFLSNISKVTFYDINYKLVKIKWLILVRLLYSQIRLLILLRKYRKEDVVFYVNTILPFGAALAGKLYGIKVIYHIHETSITPQIWKTFLLKVVKFTASEIIYVSNFLKNKEPIKSVSCKVIYNAISDDFISVKRKSSIKKTILMACSLKKYKGVYEFINLAKLLKEYHFALVLNATQKEINDYFKSTEITSNLTLYPKQSNLHPFYEEAYIVLNLSIPSLWIETFGLTIIEAMSYGIPTIVPSVGGPAEIIQNKSNGFTIDSNDILKLKETISTLLETPELYNRISSEALRSTNKFSLTVFNSKIKNVLDLT